MTNIDTALVERAKELLVTELRCDGAHLLAGVIENLNDGAILSNPPTSSAIRAIVKALQSTRDTLSNPDGEREALPVGEEWRDIASAPKDGTKFDAWVPDAFGGHRMTNLSFNARGQLRQHGLLTPADLPRWPTHWMPTPPPPGSAPVTSTQGEEEERARIVAYIRRYSPHEFIQKLLDDVADAIERCEHLPTQPAVGEESVE